MRRKSGLICAAATVIIAGYLLALGMADEAAVEARIVRVTRADVHQIIPLTGRLEYADEWMVYAAVGGRVSRVCAFPGQRVAAGEALIRLDTAMKENVLSAFSDAASHNNMASNTYVNGLLDSTMVIRSEEAAFVRQVFAMEDTHIAPGTPVARLTGNEQRIAAAATAREGADIHEGMWAWIYADGIPYGQATIEQISAHEADALTGIVRSEIVLKPHQRIDLPEGTTMDVDVFIAGSDDVLSLPVDAITERDTVWWVIEGRCTEIPAGIVLCDEIRAWVDLPEGMQVALGEFSEGQRIVEAAE